MATKPIPQVGIEEALDPDEQAALAAEAEGQEGIQADAPFTPQPEGETVPPETPAEAAPAADGKPPKGKQSASVPFDRFKEINDDLKTERQARAELQEKWARLEERARIAREADARVQAAAQQPQGPPRPDEAVDPYGAQLWDRDRKIEALERQQQAIQQGVQLTQQQLQQRAQFDDYANWLRTEVQRYSQTDPEYPQAAAFAENQIRAWGQSLANPHSTPQQQQAWANEVETVLGQLTMWAAGAAQRNGISPAQAFRGFADIMGYKSQAATPNPAPNGNGQQQATPTPAETARIKLEQARKGQAHQGLSRVPQELEETKNWTTMTAADAAEYDEDRFVEEMNDPKKRQMWNQFFARLEGVS